MGTDNSIFWIQLITGIISFAIIILGGILVFLLYKNKKAKLEGEEKAGDKNTEAKKSENKQQGRASIKKFMEFDDILDNMIVRKNRQQYIMVIKCKGINYDLLSEEEKIAVENGFTQFLNTLRFPVQLYVQTRSLNLRDIIEVYNSKVDGLRQEVEDLELKIKKAKLSGNIDLQERLEFDKRRKANVLAYGTDITDYIGRMSMNKNVLQQNTYVIVSYYASEIGAEISNYAKQEIDSMCFNELYIRTQSIIRGLAAAEVYGRILESEELAELLYIAYNRDDAEIIQLRKALEAEYDSFYSTAPDIMQKRIEKLQNDIEQEAADLATESMLEADRIRMLERSKKNKIKERAIELVEEYRDEMDKDLYLGTKAQIEKYNTSENEITEQAENAISVEKENNIKRARRKKEQ